MVGDTIGDLIIRLKNAGMAKKKELTVPFSGLRLSILNKLLEVGYIESVHSEGDLAQNKILRVVLMYEGDKSRINGVKRLSKPGCRLYAKKSELYPVKFGKGNMILSTSKGILTNEEAKKQGVGGEKLFIIW